MKNNTFKKAGFISLLVTLLMAFQVNGQLIVDSSVTADQMVSNILGPGVTASNIVLNCDPIGSGAFTNGGSTNIGIDDGVLLTSGDVNDAPGPNESGGITYNSSEPGDADLDALITPFVTNDACVLEFDFIATGDQITVQYVFASDEYNEYVCSTFNDVFAFFVSGNNPAGGVYSNENVALVPGDSEAVAINNVNNGSPGANGSLENCGSLDNDAFFVDNSLIDPATTIEYDGFTVSLFATVNIIPGETYHFKFAIADASDSSFDSGVFIKAESFSIFTCDAGTLSIEGSAEICTDDDIEDILEVFTTSILPDDTYVYALTDGSGEILAVQASNLLNMEPYPNDTYFIYGVSYDGFEPVGLVVGGNIGSILILDGCFEISDPLAVVLTNCLGDGCTDQTACNYDPSATVDDGSCIYCDDQDPCTVDTCEPATGGCIYTPIDCDDGDPCTVDECDPNSSTGCLNTPIDCDDGDPCTIDECAPPGATGCINTPIDCDDGNPCTIDECDPSSSTGCLNTPIDCDDGNPCTIDECDPSGDGCIYTTVGGPVNDFAEGALPNTPDRLWGVPGWDTFDVGCATLSAQSCDESSPTSDSWYSFVAQAENQGILVRANPADPNAANVDMAVEIFDDALMPLAGTTGGSCVESRSCFNNAGAGEIERCVPGGLIVGDTYFYRVYDAAGGATGTTLLVDTKVKTYASHPITVGCVNDGLDNTWTIESPQNLYNIPPVPVFNVRLVMKDLGGSIVSMTPSQSPTAAGGLTFDLSEFVPAIPDGSYTVHAQHDVKMHANGCVSAYWSEVGPGCAFDLGEGESAEGLVGLSGIAESINLSVYPNPNTGDEVFVQLNNIENKSQVITLELFDAYGKKVVSERYASSGTVFKQVVTFDNKLVGGVYFVQLNVDGHVVTQKLRIE